MVLAAERARRLADATGGAHEGDDVRPRHAGMRQQPLPRAAPPRSPRGRRSAAGRVSERARALPAGPEARRRERRASVGSSKPEAGAGVQQVGAARGDPVLVELPQPVDLAGDLRHAGPLAEQVGRDRPQRLAALDDMDPGAGRDCGRPCSGSCRPRRGPSRGASWPVPATGAGAAMTRGWTAGFVRFTARSPLRALGGVHADAVPTRPARSRRADRRPAERRARRGSAAAGSSVVARGFVERLLGRLAPRRLHRPVLGLRHDGRRRVVLRGRPAVGPPGRRLADIARPGRGSSTTSAEPSTSWSGPAATAAAGAPTPENASRPAAIAACVRRDTSSSPVERAGEPIATADGTARVERQPGMVLRQP